MSLGPLGAAAALERALAAALAADPSLKVLTFGHIHLDEPAALVPPYLAFTETRASDWSAGTDSGARVALTLEAVTADGSRSRAHRAIAAATAVALALPAALDGARLVMIRPLDAAIERRRGARGWRARGRLEALIEV